MKKERMNRVACVKWRAQADNSSITWPLAGQSLLERRWRRRDDRSRWPQNRRRVGTPTVSIHTSSCHSTLCRYVSRSCDDGGRSLPLSWSRDDTWSLCCCCCWWLRRFTSFPEVWISWRSKTSSSSSVTSSANRMSSSSTVNVRPLLLVSACVDDVAPAGTGSSNVTSFVSLLRRTVASCSDRLKSGELSMDWWAWSLLAAETVTGATTLRVDDVAADDAGPGWLPVWAVTTAIVRRLAADSRWSLSATR